MSARTALGPPPPAAGTQAGSASTPSQPPGPGAKRRCPAGAHCGAVRTKTGRCKPPGGAAGNPRSGSLLPFRNPSPAAGDTRGFPPPQPRGCPWTRLRTGGRGGGSPTSSLPPTVTCPAPVSAALELEGDGGAERLEPPRPAAAAAGGAGRPRHARPARARRRTDSPSSANAAYQRSGGGAGGRSPAIIGCPQPTDPPSLTKANEISPQAPPPRTRCKA